MKILVRSNRSSEWEPADPVNTEAEVELQNLLIESPSLIPIEEIREGASPLVFAVGEFGLPGSGSTDVLAFSADGDIAIVECKLAANPESKRKVIGQILEYASFLWGMDYQEVNRRIHQLKGRPLPDLIEEAVAGEWDQSSFEEGVTQSLTSGNFILVIVVDQMTEELRRIIRYINARSESGFSLHALELNRFRAGDMEILVPQLHGLSARPTTTGTRKRRRWTREEFFEALRASVAPDTAAIVEDLYEWAEATADQIWFGTGTETGSFSFHYLRGGKTVPVFTVYTNGRLQLSYGGLSTQISTDAADMFHRRVAVIPAFSRIPADFSKWPTLAITDAFRSPEDIQTFKRAVEQLRDMIGLQES